MPFFFKPISGNENLKENSPFAPRKKKQRQTQGITWSKLIIVLPQNLRFMTVVKTYGSADEAGRFVDDKRFFTHVTNN